MNSLIKLSDIDILDGVQFENLIYQLLTNMGFDVETTKASGDGGVDLIAYNKQPIIKGKYIIQCKRWISSVGEPILRDLYGAMTHERANKGILITSGTFTQSAINFSKEKPLELIGRDQLEDLLLEYGLLNDNNDLSVENSRIYKSDDDYFEEGFAKCIHVESTDYGDEDWVEDYSWGKLSVTPDGILLDNIVDNKGQIGSCGIFNIRFLDISHSYEPNAILRGYKLKGSSTHLLKIAFQDKYIMEIKVFIFEASHDVCNEIFKELVDIKASTTNKNCFVATVVYESNECIQVNKLRQWRDNYLNRYTLGRLFIKMYYKYGENLSLIVDKRPFIKRYIKKILDRFVSRL